MKKKYDAIAGFENIYLEDSYVLKITEAENIIEFYLDLVLTPKHPQYKLPSKDEQYCYRKAKISFPKLRKIKWQKRGFLQFTDANNEVDCGNIDEFYLDDGFYHLSGDWGDVQILSDLPKVELL